MLKRFVVLSLCSATILSAQDNSSRPVAGFRAPPPSISGTASSDVKFTPDRATVRVSVQTQASTAAAAASQNATKQNAVLKALHALGLSNDQLSTADFSVAPEYRYEQNKSPVLIGYKVTNTVVADVRDISQIGKVLDAALSNGANLISSLDFYASNTDSARQEAVAAAVKKARTEAETAARAAGGTLGNLISLNIGGGNYAPPPAPFMMRAAAKADMAESTPINPGQQTITVTVTARWGFLPAS
jgi:uncharacterized protein YggE